MSDELRTLLTRAAGPPPHQIDMGALSERRARLRRRRVSVLMSSAVLVVAVGLFVNGFADFQSWFGPPQNQGLDGQLPPVGASSAAPSPPNASRGPCDFAPVRPNYLPWLDTQDTVGSPKREQSNDLSALYWDKASSDGPYYVGLERTSGTSYADEGKPVLSKIEGAEGQLYRGPSGSMHVEWELPQSECNYIALVLVFPETAFPTPEEAEKELVKVAESLHPSDWSEGS